MTRFPGVMLLHSHRAPDAAIFAGATGRPLQETPHELVGHQHDADNMAPTTMDEGSGLFIAVTAPRTPS